jgi:hypothetical protein
LKTDPIKREINKPTTNVPTVQDIIGRALDKIGNYSRLDNTKQVVALIDEVI